MIENVPSNPDPQDFEADDLEAEDPDQEASGTTLNIAGIHEPVILRYFETLNAGDFTAAGALFAETGELHAPFEDPIVGPSAITAYLEQEAKGIRLNPQQGQQVPRTDEYQEFQITGRVKTPLFSVKVAWFFVLTPDQELAAVAIKLLASMENLVKLRDKLNLKD